MLAGDARVLLCILEDLEGRLMAALQVLEVIHYVLRRLNVVDGKLCLLGVLEVPEAVRYVLIRTQEVVEVGSTAGGDGLHCDLHAGGCGAWAQDEAASQSASPHDYFGALFTEEGKLHEHYWSKDINWRLPPYIHLGASCRHDAAH